MPDGFGRFVLLGELETSWRGTEYRAAALAGTEFERLVSLLRIAPALGESEPLLEHLRAGARLGGPHALAIHEIGRVERTAFVASELVEGKSLRAVLARAREEAMPIAPDNALQVASRVAAALAYAHGHLSPEGAPFVHGMVGPDSVIVSYDGEVAVRGFGWWTSRAWEGRLPDEELRHLAPEQRGGLADPRSDVFGVGALLLECLTGAPPDAPLGEARLPDGEPLPSVVAEVLTKALNPDAAHRFADAHELRRALDALLFSGDFSPTTFNLAYFMYTLFRDTAEQEARLLQRERQAYAEHVRAVPRQEAAAKAARPEAPAARPAPAGPGSVHHAAPSTHHPAVPARHPVASSAKVPGGRPAARVAGPRRAQTGGGLAVKLGASALVLVAAGYFLFFFPRAPAVPAPTPEPTLPPDEVAALARVRELEARLAAIEQEKAQAEAAAAEAARQRLEAEAARKGRAVDRAAVARAQEEAARLARSEQDQRQEVEKKRIEEEMQAEEARLAAARAAATPAPALAPTPTPSTALAPTPEPTPTTSTAPAIAVAAAVGVSGPASGEPSPSAPTGAPAAPVVHAVGEPGVTAPVLQKGPRVEYPQLARVTRAEGVVVVSALVDEKGRVSEAKAITRGNQILRDAAVAHVLQRLYSPGKKDGVAVRVRIVVQVAFNFQR